MSLQDEYRELMAKPIEEVREDIFFRPDNFREEPWYGDFQMFLAIGVCQPPEEYTLQVRKALKVMGYDMGFGLTERYDVLDWVNWAIDRCGKEIPIYLAGVSMGATAVLMAAGLDLPNNVHGIAGDCGFTSPQAIWKHVANKNLHLIYGLKGIMADTMFKQRLQMATDDYSTVDALACSKTPVLLIHGTEDHFVPVEMTYENYTACKAPKKLLIVPGADHGMSYFTDKKSYERIVKEFWEEFD